jgi:hypothetical protein
LPVSSYDAFFGAALKAALILVCALAAWLAWKHVRATLKEKSAKAALSTSRFQQVTALAGTQSAVIDTLISEMSAVPALYAAAMSPELQDRIYAAHTAAQETRNERKN